MVFIRVWTKWEFTFSREWMNGSREVINKEICTQLGFPLWPVGRPYLSYSTCHIQFDLLVYDDTEILPRRGKRCMLRKAPTLLWCIVNMASYKEQSKKVGKSCLESWQARTLRLSIKVLQDSGSILTTLLHIFALCLSSVLCNSEQQKKEAYLNFIPPMLCGVPIYSCWARKQKTGGICINHEKYSIDSACGLSVCCNTHSTSSWIKDHYDCTNHGIHIFMFHMNAPLYTNPTCAQHATCLPTPLCIPQASMCCGQGRERTNVNQQSLSPSGL